MILQIGHPAVTNNCYACRYGCPLVAPCIAQRSFPTSWALRLAKSPAVSDGDSSGKSWRTATKHRRDLQAPFALHFQKTTLVYACGPKTVPVKRTFLNIAIVGWGVVGWGGHVNVPCTSCMIYCHAAEISGIVYYVTCCYAAEISGIMYYVTCCYAAEISGIVYYVTCCYAAEISGIVYYVTCCYAAEISGIVYYVTCCYAAEISGIVYYVTCCYAAEISGIVYYVTCCYAAEISGIVYYVTCCYAAYGFGCGSDA